MESDLDQAIDNIEEKLRANGLYNATIQRRVDLRPDTEEANVYFDLDTGYRAHFDGVELAGQINRPKESVINDHGLASRLRPDPASGMAGSDRKPGANRPGTLAEGFPEGRPAGSQGTLDKLDYHPATQHGHARI